MELHITKKTFKVPRSRQVVQKFSVQSSSRSAQLQQKIRGQVEYEYKTMVEWL
jgi:hypothetical protein